MQIVGIDLGTTNLRIAKWDSEQPEIPQPMPIGQGDSYVVPAVIAFRRLPNGEVEIIVGEDADSLEDGPNQIVVENIKRYALSEDAYVRWHMESREEPWDSWWNPESRCVQVWGQDFPVQDLVSLIVKEGLQRAGVEPGFEWRAGCPVHAGMSYRSDLAQVITKLGGLGQGEVSRIVEEPILFLILAHQLGVLAPGSYLVYDLGGGSFDCALAQISEGNTGNQMVVYGAAGNPSTGGADIDRFLINELGYTEARSLLRLAKEATTPDSSQRELPGGKTLTWQQVLNAVKSRGFIPLTHAALRDAYTGAKVIWGRESPDAPVGDIIRRSPDTGQVKFVWQLGWDDITDDIDAVILYGGPTRSPLFAEALRERFGAEKVIATSELMPPEIPDPELTAISAGACYAAQGQYSPLYINRIPARITLEDHQTGARVQYEPYQHLPPATNPFHVFVSGEFLSEESDAPYSANRYELTITTPEGVLLMEPLWVEDYIDSRLIGSRLRLVINQLGQVGVEQESDKTARKIYQVVENPPWQTEEQREAIQRLLEQEREYRQEESVRMYQNLNRNPWGWQEHSG